MSLTKQNLISPPLLYHVPQNKLNLETDTGNERKIFYLHQRTTNVWISDFYNSVVDSAFILLTLRIVQVSHL